MSCRWLRGPASLISAGKTSTCVGWPTAISCRAGSSATATAHTTCQAITQSNRPLARMVNPDYLADRNVCPTLRRFDFWSGRAVVDDVQADIAGEDGPAAVGVFGKGEIPHRVLTLSEVLRTLEGQLIRLF